MKEAYQPALAAELAMPRPYVLSPKDFKHGTTKDGVKSFDGPFKMGEHKKIYLQNLIKIINIGEKRQS